MISPYADFTGYFSQTQPGDIRDWAGGQISMGEGGQATYTGPLGAATTFDVNTPMMDLYQNPNIAQQWNEQYSDNFSRDLPWNEQYSNNFPQSPTGAAFDFPFDLYPSSSSGSSSSSYSGLPPQYREQLLSGIIPELLQSVQNMPGNIDQYTQDAMNAYGSTFKNMATKAMPSVLNDIFGRNMQESSIAGDVTSKAMSDITAGLQPQAYQTAMQAALLKSQMPGLLANIAGLGSYTQASGSQSAKSSDPGKPYATALNFLQNMMQ